MGHLGPLSRETSRGLMRMTPVRSASQAFEPTSLIGFSEWPLSTPSGPRSGYQASDLITRNVHSKPKNAASRIPCTKSISEPLDEHFNTPNRNSLQSRETASAATGAPQGCDSHRLCQVASPSGPAGGAVRALPESRIVLRIGSRSTLRRGNWINRAAIALNP
jgi:hypothetical protein